ncbi:lipopolysaccharide assembly LapA domain-containing protein [Roseateles sp. BYS180W]|uniref:Lipopolysaccharide assembly LapA domain-containing protein n=1 Tax=Roseateles rivi TaxID=3299028 RepID=A0ABW7FY27_9BURK
MRVLVWLFRAFVFFTLFAFSLNNSQEVRVHWFFGQTWHAPLIIVVLLVFALGCAFGVLAMLPGWWRQRRIARVEARRAAATQTAPADPVPPHPDGI